MGAGRCSNSWGPWRGGRFAAGNGGSGALWLPDLESVPDARTAVLAAPAGSKVDVFVDKTDASTYVCTVQHVDDGTNPAYARIDYFRFSALPSLTSSVIDLSDSAEIEVISGAAPTWNSGLSTSGDVEIGLQLLGPDYRSYASDVYCELLISDAATTPADNSFVGFGLIDRAAKGAARLMGGLGYYLAGVRWVSAGRFGGTTLRSTSVIDRVWAAGVMPAAPDRATLQAINNFYGGRSSTELSGNLRPHAGADANNRPSSTVLASIVTATETLIGYQVDTAGSTTIDLVLDAVSRCPLSIPDLGY